MTPTSFARMRIAAGVSTFLALLLCCISAFALDPSLPLSKLRHSSWTAKDGVPGRIRFIDQDKDGFLWLVCGDGLYRFDGTTFQHVTELGGKSLSGMLVITVQFERDGDMWLGLADGLARVHAGRFEWLGRPLVRGVVFGIVKDLDANIWCVSSGRLVLLNGEKQVDIGKDWDYPEASTASIALDKQGTLWTTAKRRLFMLKRGERRFVEYKLNGFMYEIVEAASDGTVWISGADGARLVADRSGLLEHSLLLTSTPGGDPVVDRDGSYWMASGPELVRARTTRAKMENANPSVLYDHFGVQDGLTSNTVFRVFEDREGNIWVGTSAGLDRFRNPKVVSIDLPPSRDMGYGLAAGAGGAVYVAPWAEDLYTVVGDQMRNSRAREVMSATTSMYVDPGGVLWAGGQLGVYRSIDHENFVSMQKEDAVAEFTRAMTMDKAGNLWAGEGGVGRAARLSNGSWDYPSGRDGFPKKWNFRAALTGTDGQLWFAFEQQIVNVVDGHARTLDSKSTGLDVGVISAFCEVAGHLWVGGSAGLAFFDGLRFHKVLNEEGSSFPSITGLVGTRSGELWANVFAETIRIRAVDVRALLAHSKRPLVAQHLGEIDGRKGSSAITNPRPNLIEGGDGRIWVSTDSSVAWIDPTRLDQIGAPPAVIVTTVSADGRSYAPNDSVALPPLNQHFELHYTATELAVPEKIRFRYRLDGVDKDWQLVGLRRFALYNNLGPGQYKFRVASTDAEGRWNPVETTLQFGVMPAWYQTAAFRVACATGLLVVAWLVYRVWLAQMLRRVGWQLRTQVLERERIARELHDTLLQSFYGLSMQFYSVAEKMPAGGRDREHLTSVLQRADKALLEGREKVEDLRDLSQSSLNLTEIVALAEAEVDRKSSTHVHTLTTGVELDLHPVVIEQVAGILRESLLNALRHANATSIHVHCVYSPRSFQVSVEDDGSGMTATMIQGGKAQHWGLLGIRERAQRIGGHLLVESRPGQGTKIEVRVNGAIAYVNRTGWLSRLVGKLNALRIVRST